MSLLKRLGFRAQLTTDNSLLKNLQNQGLNFEPFITDGFVSLSCDFAAATPVKILRDTESSQSLILADALPFLTKRHLGQMFSFKE